MVFETEKLQLCVRPWTLLTMLNFSDDRQNGISMSFLLLVAETITYLLLHICQVFRQDHFLPMIWSASLNVCLSWLPCNKWSSFKIIARSSPVSIPSSWSSKKRELNNYLLIIPAELPGLLLVSYNAAS